MSSRVRVAVVNYSCGLEDGALRSGLAALQTQVSEHLSPAWGTDAELFVLDPPVPCAGVFGLMLRGARSGAAGDPPPEATSGGLPLANVFLGDLGQGEDWTHAASRELMHLLVDPIVGRLVYRQSDNGAGAAQHAYLHDVAAPCAGYEHGYQVGSWRVSDFVHPAWFGESARDRGEGRFDQRGLIQSAFGVLPGERVFAYDLAGDHWLAIGADAATALPSRTPAEPAGRGADRLVQLFAGPRGRILLREPCSDAVGRTRPRPGVPGGP